MIDLLRIFSLTFFIPLLSSTRTTSPSYRPSISTLPSLAPTRSPLKILPSAFDIVTDTDTSDNQESCSSILLRVELKTDNYPTDVSWYFADRSNGIILMSSPLGGYSGEKLRGGKQESQVDIRNICLGSNIAENVDDATTGKFEFVIRDKYGDGLCCRKNNEPGYYRLMQYVANDEGVNEANWKVLVSGSNFKSKEVQHHFELRFSNDIGKDISDIDQSLIPGEKESRSLPNVTTSVPSSVLNLACSPSQRKITIDILTDRHGSDTSWELYELSNKGRRGEILARNEQAYGRQERDTREVCLDDKSLYEFKVVDVYGDGLCCRYGNGHYKIHKHNAISDSGDESTPKLETILYGGSFSGNEITHIINTTQPIMSERDDAWLTSHNTRRKYWHEYYNTTYVPLLWSESLKEEAQEWADTLLDFCGKGMRHDPERVYGENAAGNTGSGTWGTRREPDKILTRFVEYELDDEWPKNGHLVQTVSYLSSFISVARYV